MARVDFQEVPVVDYLDLARDRRKFFRDLEHALCNVGFMVYVNVPGFDAAFQDRAFAAAHAFFDNPAEVKEACDMVHSPHYRGYTNFRTSGKAELVSEAYQMGPEEPSVTDPSIPIWNRMRRGPNLWPELPGFRETISEVWDRYLPVSRELGHLICELLEVDRDRYDRYFLEKDPEYVAALNHTVAVSELDEAFQEQVAKDMLKVSGNGAHVDGAPFISMLIADQPGLQVLRLDGKTWADAPVIPGSIIVNIGNTLQYLSGRRMVATMHRVHPLKPTKRRISIPYFLLPSLDKDLEPFDGRKPNPRNRGVDYALDRMTLFSRCTKRWYPDEYERVKAEAIEQDKQIRERRAMASKL